MLKAHCRQIPFSEYLGDFSAHQLFNTYWVDLDESKIQQVQHVQAANPGHSAGIHWHGYCHSLTPQSASVHLHSILPSQWQYADGGQKNTQEEQPLYQGTVPSRDIAFVTGGPWLLIEILLSV